MNENQKSLLFCVLSIALLFIADFIFLMKPQLNIIKEINPRLRNTLRNVKAVQADLEQKENFERRYKIAKEKMQNMDKLIPKEEEISLILDEISLTSKESNVKITQLKPLKENKKVILEASAGSYYRLPIYIEAFCGYHQFGKFLNSIEYSNIFMKTVEIEMIQNSKDIRNHQLRLVIDAFVIRK
jgi:Tfp pilus assembly protein PilO